MIVRYGMVGEYLQATAVHGFALVWTGDTIEAKIVNPDEDVGDQFAEVPRKQFDNLYHKVCAYAALRACHPDFAESSAMKRLYSDVEEHSRTILEILRGPAEADVYKQKKEDARRAQSA
ncbi:hypothetical protein ACFL3V_02555 [Nanoarchaeota archaeon]